MPLVIRDTSVVPNERWHYIVAATGFRIDAPNYNALYSEIVNHCSGNGVPVPTEQDVIDWLCANVGVPCYDSTTREPLINRFGLPSKPAASCCGSAPLPTQKEAV